MCPCFVVSSGKLHSFLQLSWLKTFTYHSLFDRSGKLPVWTDCCHGGCVLAVFSYCQISHDGIRYTETSQFYVSSHLSCFSCRNTDIICFLEVSWHPITRAATISDILQLSLPEEFTIRISLRFLQKIWSKNYNNVISQIHL